MGQQLAAFFYVSLAKAHDTPVSLLNQRPGLAAACVQTAASRIKAAAATSSRATTGREADRRGSAATASATRTGRSRCGLAAKCRERAEDGYATAATKA